MIVHIVIGSKENVYQDEIGGQFIPHPDKEIVRVFPDESQAIEFIKRCKLKKPKHEPFGDTSYYRGGYCDMEIESHEVEDIK